mgnify:CR=1 FL=1
MFTKYKTFIIYSGAVLLILLALLLNQFTPISKKQYDDIFIPNAEAISPKETTPYITVDIKGAVLNPGVYIMDVDSRMYQLIDKAGGVLKDANLDHINLAMFLSDAKSYTVPKEGEAIPVIENPLININEASIERLSSLPNIGPSTAQAIIDFREDEPFKTNEDIMNVRGIGEATFEAIKDLITH